MMMVLRGFLSIISMGGKSMIKNVRSALLTILQVTYVTPLVLCGKYFIKHAEHSTYRLLSLYLYLRSN